MQANVDSAIADFVLTILKDGEASSRYRTPSVLFNEAVQKLIDAVRAFYDLDVVYIMKQLDSRYDFNFAYESLKEAKYSNGGIVMHLSPEGFNEVLHMYDADGVSAYNVSDMASVANDVSDCIMHYGFVRLDCNRYDGSIGFQMFSPHKWTAQERGTLIKLGRLLKMVFSVSIAEGMQNQLLDDLETEINTYRRTLSEGALYLFKFDVNEGLIRERIITSKGIDILAKLNILLPADYDEANARFIASRGIQVIDKKTLPCYNCQGIISYWEKGINSPFTEYYDSENGTYTRSTLYLRKDEATGHIIALVVANDVTDEKKAEKQQKKLLQDAYKAANAANDAKTHFLEQMSHDIRTPLNGIVGMTEIAKANAGNKEKVIDCLDKISMASDHLLGIIGEVLDISKIEAGLVHLKQEAFYISKMIQSISTIIQPQANEKEHNFVIDTSAVKHDKVIGDQARLEQALINFLGNAIKYTAQGGLIRLEVSEKTESRIMGKKSGGDALCNTYQFVVEDNGFGMSEEFMEHLFEPFSRSDDVRTKGIQGTGLGMAIAKNTIQMMNGTIKVNSKLGKGTRFSIKVCLATAKGEEAEPNLLDSSYKAQYEDAAANSGGKASLDAYRDKFTGKSALVVEDNDLNCEIAVEILKMMGFKTDYAKDGKEAVCKVEHSDEGFYDVILMDVQMPVMNGLDATRAIRQLQRRDCTRILIIAMTANAFTENAEACERAGMDAALSKPIDINALGKALEEGLFV